MGGEEEKKVSFVCEEKGVVLGVVRSGQRCR